MASASAGAGREWAGSLRRLPFAPGEAQAMADFCVAHGCVHDEALVRRLLCDLTSQADGVLVWGDDQGPAIVATVVDRAPNGADAASLEILGARAPLDAEALARWVVTPAVAFARTGPRRALHLSLYPWLVDVRGAERTLLTEGFVPAYVSFVMRRPPDLPVPASAPLEGGWTWARLDDARVDAAHAALGDIFAGAPSTSLPPVSDFRRSALAGPDVWQLLLDGDRIAGLLRVLNAGEGTGKVGMLGRNPAYRGRGLGPLLLAEALRMLAERGARDVSLDVDAANEPALDLYRRFGFEVTTRTPVLGLALGPA